MGGDSDSSSGSSMLNKVGKSLKKRFGRKSSSSMGKDPGGEAGGGDYSESASGTPTFHKGGVVRKTGPAILKRGEHVLTRAQFKRATKRQRRK